MWRNSQDRTITGGTKKVKKKNVKKRGKRKKKQKKKKQTI